MLASTLGRKGQAVPAATARPGSTDPWIVATACWIAAWAAVLAIVTFRFHPIGDYFTESDFYAGYVEGARLLMSGHLDLARYGVYGPGYEWLLALAGRVSGDLFVAARAISLLSAIAVLVCSGLALRRVGSAAAAWIVVLISVCPAFVRYTVSVGTDMLGAALWSAAFAMLVRGRGTRQFAFAGLLAAAATLVRYNYVMLLPAGLVVAGFVPEARGKRWRVMGAFAGSFIAGMLPFVLAATLSGHPPGATLVGDAPYYLHDAPQTMLEQRYAPGATTPVPPEAAPTVRGATGAFALARRTAAGIPGHLRDDARWLLTYPAAIASALALAWLLARRRAAPLWPLLPPAAFTFLALAPVFYSERYSLPLLPVYLAPLAAVLAAAMAAGRRAAFPAALLALLVAGWAAREAVDLQQRVYRSIPHEALAAGRAIRAISQPGERVVARKAHVAYHAGLEPVLLTDVPTLEALAELCRERQVRYLYFSWYELRLRPQFGFLLDTAAVVPGLTPVFASLSKPSAAYRIDPEFGRLPEWWQDARERERIGLRVNAMMAPPDESAALFARSSEAALELDRPSLAWMDASLALRANPRQPGARVVRGYALLKLRRPREAMTDFDAVLATDETNSLAIAGRERAQASIAAGQ
jgi:hypothetical protein